MAYPWFRAYSEMLHDPKIRRMSPAQRWVWVGLLCLASDSEERGTLELAPGVAYDLDDFEGALGVDAETVETCLAMAAKLGMIRYDGTKLIIVNWDKRQYDNPSDVPEATRARQRKHRQAQRDEPACHEQAPERVTTAVTTMSRDVTTQTRLDTDTDTDIAPAAQHEPVAADAASNPGAKAIGAVYQAWEDVNPRRQVTPLDADKLAALVDEHGAEAVLGAIRAANDYGKPYLAYIDAVLRNKGAPVELPPKPKPKNPIVRVHNPVTDQIEEYNNETGEMRVIRRVNDGDHTNRGPTAVTAG